MVQNALNKVDKISDIIGYVGGKYKKYVMELDDIHILMCGSIRTGEKQQIDANSNPFACSFPK